MSQLEEWLLMLAVGLGVYSIVVTVAWWRDSRAVDNFIECIKPVQWPPWDNEIHEGRLAAKEYTQAPIRGTNAITDGTQNTASD